ncbi:hypothetical protein RMQ97_00320 [Maricaulis sp. D1M11]|uniref:hypothetical protein n=1 Tax=Maricaulis sp. D1M11 TaxID=3076117 RepID=UPI0039B63CF4
MSWRQCIVELRGRRSDGKIGVCTAFFVSNILALTCKHGLYYRDQRLSDIRARPSENEPNCEFETTIVGECKNSDIAVILVTDYSSQWMIRLSSELPQSGTRCATRGFPEGAKVDNQRSAISLFGTAHSYVEGQDFIQVDTDVDPDENPEWGGLSGAPMVTEDTKMPSLAFGVVRTVRNAMGKSRHLEVIPAHDILNCPEYCSALAEHHSELTRAVRKSRLMAALAGGKSGQRLNAESGHHAWYQKDYLTLVKAGLMYQSTHERTLLGMTITEIVEQSGGFEYLY